MDNRFFVDGEHLSPPALEKKHRLETDSSSRTNHMEYMSGMEQIKSDIMCKVLSETDSYDYSGYTAKDVKAALEHETCSIEDFKALLSPAAEPSEDGSWRYGIRTLFPRCRGGDGLHSASW